MTEENPPKIEETVVEESDSDDSIATDDMTDLNSNIKDTFETKPQEKSPTPVTEEKKVDIVKKPRKPYVMTDARKKAFEKARATRAENIKQRKEQKALKKKKPPPYVEPPVEQLIKEDADDEAVNEVVIRRVKKKRGRPSIPIEEKLARQIITKEKVIYMIQDSKGNYVETDPTKMKKKELKKVQFEKEAQEMEEKLGVALMRNKNGKARKPYVMTEARKKAIGAMVENTRRRREERKVQKDKVKVEKVEKQKEVIQEAVDKSIRKVVSQPAPKPVKTLDEQFNEFFG